MVALTGGAWWSRGTAVPELLAIEMLAQAAVLLLDPPAADAGDGGSRSVQGMAAGYLAGVEGIELRAPLEPGDRYAIEVVLERRFGSLLKVRATMRNGLDADAAVVACGSLLLGVGGIGGAS